MCNEPIYDNNANDCAEHMRLHQIAQHVIGIFRRNSGLMEAHVLSAVVGVVIAYWFVTHGMLLNAMFLASMVMNNIQALQSGYGPRNW